MNVGEGKFSGSHIHRHIRRHMANDQLSAQISSFRQHKHLRQWTVMFGKVEKEFSIWHTALWLWVNPRMVATGGWSRGLPRRSFALPWSHLARYLLSKIVVKNYEDDPRTLEELKNEIRQIVNEITKIVSHVFRIFPTYIMFASRKVKFL